MSPTVTILCAAKLHQNQLERHLELFEYIPEVRRVLVVRREPLEQRLRKIENRAFGPASLGVEMQRMTAKVASLCRSEQVDWVIGFNPVPWGSLALIGAKVAGKKACLSLIGMDFLQVQRRWGRPFLVALRNADAVTVTGASMRERLGELGVAKEKIFILPHSVDLERFAPSSTDRAFDVVAVGQLIRRKRLDVLIDATSQLKKQGICIRVGILGRGPLEAELRARCDELNITSQVEFLGYRNDVESVLRQSRAFCLASEWEGVPFALMEAMAAGLVPVMTRVGTIDDWIRDGVNGRLVPVGNVAALAEAISCVLGPSGDSMRRTLLNERARLSFEHGAAVWREVLQLKHPKP